MTTIGSIPYGQSARSNSTDNLDISRKAAGATITGSPVSSSADVEDRSSDTQLIESTDDDTDTFLYNQTGKLNEPTPTTPIVPSGRFASFDEEHHFRWHASEEELTEFYGAKITESIMKDRENVRQAIAVFQQTLANAKRDNPEFVANMDRTRALDSVSSIEDNLKLLNIYRETRDNPTGLSSSRALAATWVAHFLSNVQDYSEAMRSIVDVAGDLIRQQDDGTYVLSNFTLSYESVQFFEHKE